MPVPARLLEVPWRSLRADVALPAIGRVLDGEPAERAVDRALRRAPELDGPGRAAAAEAIFGVALWRRRLAGGANPSPASLLFSLLRDLAGIPDDDAARLSGATRPFPERRPIPHRLADRWSLPDWLESLLLRELGDEAEDFCRAISTPGPVCVRANRLRCTREELAAELAGEGIASSPTPLARDGLLLAGRPNLFGLRSWREGWFEPQDEGSQLVGALVDPEPHDTVLDFCAGAGGKSLLLAAALRGRGRLIAHDPDTGRISRLRTRANRAGARIEIGGPCEADRVLVDAPCSELGTLRRGPDARWRISPGIVAEMAALQREILERAAPFARRRLVYATCTIARAENEEVAFAFERAHPEWVRVPPHPCGTDEGYFLCLPHRHGTDGFFAAVWERR